MRKQTPPETALYVRLPSAAIDKLHRAAESLGVHKKDLVAGLVSKYVDPDSAHGLSALGALAQRPPVAADLSSSASVLGSYRFQPYDPPEVPEVMSSGQAAEFLQLTESIVVELAESGELPGRKLGAVWRFSRSALVAWLAGPER